MSSKSWMLILLQDWLDLESQWNLLSWLELFGTSTVILKLVLVALMNHTLSRH